MSKIPIKIIYLSLCFSTILPIETWAVSPVRCDTVYAVHDAGVADSQFFGYNLSKQTISTLGELHRNYDIEGLAVHPQTHILYASSGKSNAQLYTVDAKSGALSIVGNIGFDDVVGLAFHPNGSLWGWSAQGLLQIDIATGQGSLVLSGNYAIQDITWDKAGTTLYGIAEDTPEHSTLWAWVYNSDSWQVACEELPKKVEALETRPDGLFVYGFHDDQQLRIYTYDIQQCQTVVDGQIDTSFYDVEDIAWPDFECVWSNQDLLQMYLEGIGYTDVVIDAEGRISAVLAGETHLSQLDSQTTQGTPPSDGQLVLTEIEDANGDGIKDFQITYPNGEQQILFYLGVEEQTPVGDEAIIRGLWDKMNAALVAGNVQKALGYLTTGAQDKYEPVFEALLPHMSEVVASYSPLMLVSLSDEIGEFAVNRTIDGQLKLFLVYYLKGKDGTWRLEAM